MKVKSEREVIQSCQTLATPWTTAYQAPPSMGFSRQEYWSGLPLPSPNVYLISKLMKGAVTPQETDPDLPISVQESPAEGTQEHTKLVGGTPAWQARLLVLQSILLSSGMPWF